MRSKLSAARISPAIMLLVALTWGAGQASAQRPSNGSGPSAEQLAASESAGPFAAFSASAVALRDSIVALARTQVGRRYVYGGETPERGFDCSGLVRYISSLLDIRLPRTADQQSRVGVRVARDTSKLLPGDLVTFGNGRVSHIGIYVGNNRYIHASPTAGRVIESPLVRPPAPRLKPWAGVRRLFESDTTEVSHSG